MDNGYGNTQADADIVALVQRYLDGELTAEQHADLFGRLRSDGAAQTLFVRSLMQAAYLDELLAQQRSENESTRTNASLENIVTDVAPVLPASIEPPAADGAPSAFNAAPVLGWLLGCRGIGLAGAVFAAVLAAYLLNRSGDQPVAKTSEVFDARTVRIDSGSARITLPKVGYMLIDGPAEVNLMDPLRAKLICGRIRVRVTETTGRGFVVETPDGVVTDLSTEFALDVAEGRKTGVVVFDGEVDLHCADLDGEHAPRVQRLVGGEAVAFNKSGELDRIVSIVTGEVATFQSSDERPPEVPDRVIAQVSDNVRSTDLKNFYEIVPGGLKEDALTYADRPAHDWNGIDEEGMPRYLIGADYVKTFNDDKMRRDVNIFVTLARPARLFVLLDNRVEPPDWLLRDFRDTGDDIGLDAGAYGPRGMQYTFVRAIGPGKSLDARFSIWEREVAQPGVVTLGANLGASGYTGMYAIAAVGLDPWTASDSKANSEYQTARKTNARAASNQSKIEAGSR
jgi:ferric-dicitrate binding protein FerR (iron transport regulator)